MLRPLTKTRGNGLPYTRLARTSAALNALLILSRDQVRERLRIHDRNHADYVPSECLVYLLREAGRESNRSTWFNELFLALHARCERHLAHAIRYGALPDAQSAREEVIERFLLVLAEGLGPNPSRLDVFEVVFDKAFAALRKDVLRVCRRQQHRESDLVVTDGEDDTVPTAGAIIVPQPETENEMGLATAEFEIFRTQADGAIESLPHNERRAVTLLLRGHQIDSADPNEPTIAKLCNVSEKTIRNWLKSGAQRLQNQLHGDVQ